MLCISAAYAVMVSATFVYCVEMATDTAIVAMDAIILYHFVAIQRLYLTGTANITAVLLYGSQYFGNG